MSSSARCCALLLSLLASPALGQTNGVVPGHGLPAAERRTPPDWIPVGDLRGGPPARIGLVVAMRVGDGMQLGVGRFSILDLARSRTNMEREPRPTDIERRERSIAAVRWSFSF
jgi:hypothetical protein